jgi:hypothetical protein
MTETLLNVKINYSGDSILTRGKYKGMSFDKASEDENYIEYCKKNAMHAELKALIEYTEKKKVYPTTLNFP